MTEPLTLSVGVVTYESPVAVFAELLRSLQSSVHWLGSRRTVHTIVYIVCNDEDPVHLDAIASTVRQAMCHANCAIEFQLIQGHGNIGYGAAQNLVIDRVTSDFHLVLNPDIVIEKEVLTECIDFLEVNGETVMLTPQGFDSHQNYASLAKRNPTVLVLLLRALSVRPSENIFGRHVQRYIYADRLPSTSPELIDYASGCFMFCRTKSLQAVGGFDPRFFLYFEDYDLSRRLSQHGCIYELPTAKICHYGGMTVQRGWKRIQYFIRSAVVFFNRYGWRFG